MSKTKEHHHDAIERGMKPLFYIPSTDLKLFLQYLKHQEYDIDIIDNQTLHQQWVIFCDLKKMAE
jgi:hypothetical protein